MAPLSKKHTPAREWFYLRFIADHRWLPPQLPWPPECWSSAVAMATKISATTQPMNQLVATTAPTISCCGRFDAASVDFSCVVDWMMDFRRSGLWSLADKGVSSVHSHGLDDGLWVRLVKFCWQGSERAQLTVMDGMMEFRSTLWSFVNKGVHNHGLDDRR